MYSNQRKYAHCKESRKLPNSTAPPMLIKIHFLHSSDLKKPGMRKHQMHRVPPTRKKLQKGKENTGYNQSNILDVDSRHSHFDIPITLKSIIGLTWSNFG